MEKHLDGIGKGEHLYDEEFDILMFKVKERTYHKSLEMDDFVVDIDKEGFVIGIRIFDASTVFKLEKSQFQSLKDWAFTTKIENGKLMIQIEFMLPLKNKESTKERIRYIEQMQEPLQESLVECSA